jgi:response regulator RpfG family c-di-GMP phosphodiesterase
MNEQTILFVDDEPAVLRAMQRLFRTREFHILTAAGGVDGLTLLAEHNVQVVVSDQRMPGMSGTDFLKEVRRRHPETIRCILSGYAEMHSVIDAINDGNVYRFIAKPWDDEELKALIAECLDVAESMDSERLERRKLESRANALEHKNAQFVELTTLQESLVRSGRELLEYLPVAVAAMNANGTMVYTNRMFLKEFGHLPGTLLGRSAGEPWSSVACDSRPKSPMPLVIDAVMHHAHIAQVAIGGQPHTLIAIPVNSSRTPGPTI